MKKISLLISLFCWGIAFSKAQTQVDFGFNFTNDLFNGQGALQCHNGDRYEGSWKDGMRHGQGTQIIHQEGLKAYTGIWEKDKLIKDFNKKSFFDKLFGK
jgi:hypothetical protein